jgi:hypothetical protein
MGRNSPARITMRYGKSDRRPAVASAGDGSRVCPKDGEGSVGEGRGRRCDGAAEGRWGGGPEGRRGGAGTKGPHVRGR